MCLLKKYLEMYHKKPNEIKWFDKKKKWCCFACSPASEPNSNLPFSSQPDTEQKEEQLGSLIKCFKGSSVESREFGCGAKTTPRSFMNCVKQVKVVYRLHGGISHPGLTRMEKGYTYINDRYFRSIYRESLNFPTRIDGCRDMRFSDVVSKDNGTQPLSRRTRCCSFSNLAQWRVAVLQWKILWCTKNIFLPGLCTLEGGIFLLLLDTFQIQLAPVLMSIILPTLTLNRKLVK